MKHTLQKLSKLMLGSLRDLMPIMLVILFFQFFVPQQPLPNIGQLLGGVLFVVLGLTFFIHGLEQGLFPIGESMAHAFARKGSVMWLIIFAFALGFGTTVAEPALIAIAAEAANIAAEGQIIEATQEARNNYAFGLRMTVALSVGIAIVIGVIRILKGWLMGVPLSVILGTAGR